MQWAGAGGWCWLLLLVAGCWFEAGWLDWQLRVFGCAKVDFQGKIVLNEWVFCLPTPRGTFSRLDL
jgi:hypothetical protein